MFEALIEFSENSVFGLVSRIIDAEHDVETRCFQISTVVLKFAERNPGIARLLMGDVLSGENERLRHRAAQFLPDWKPQLRELLRYWAATTGSQKSVPMFRRSRIC